jgi:tetratricopeptide (TPR) repeat protein
LDQAIARDPEFWQPYYNRANARQALGDVAEAIADYRRASELAPNPAEPYNGLCWVYCMQQQPDLALPFCELAISEDPHPLYIDTRGFANALAGNYPAALADFRTSVAWLEQQQPETRWINRLQRRREWIAALESGVNPFTPELLQDLRDDWR